MAVTAAPLFPAFAARGATRTHVRYVFAIAPFKIMTPSSSSPSSFPTSPAND